MQYKRCRWQHWLTTAPGHQLPARLPVAHLHDAAGGARPADSVRLCSRLRAQRRPRLPGLLVLERAGEQDDGVQDAAPAHHGREGQRGREHELCQGSWEEPKHATARLMMDAARASADGIARVANSTSSPLFDVQRACLDMPALMLPRCAAVRSPFTVHRMHLLGNQILRELPRGRHKQFLNNSCLTHPPDQLPAPIVRCYLGTT